MLDPAILLRGISVILIMVGLFWYFQSRKNNGFGSSFGQKTGTPNLDQFAVDLVAIARRAEIDPVVGRDKEILRATQVLTRRTKNNVILVGPPGVGKTAIVEGLALRIATGDVPSVLTHKRILSLRVSELLAGTKYRGEFEQRIKGLVDDIRRSARTIILFIDEIHTVTQTKGTEGAVSLSDILKPALARGDLQMIGATTQKEYEQFIRPDESWDRRFQSVLVDEPSALEAIEILKGVRQNYENYHRVHITDDAIDAAVRLSEEYIKGRNLPDKAIDLIDEAGAMVNVQDVRAGDHASALLHSAAKTVSKREVWDNAPNVTKLKNKLTDLRLAEERATDSERLKKIRADIVATVDAIEQAEMKERGEEDWPIVDVSHIKEVVAEWIGMPFADIH